MATTEYPSDGAREPKRRFTRIRYTSGKHPKVILTWAEMSPKGRMEEKSLKSAAPPAAAFKEALQAFAAEAIQFHQLPGGYAKEPTVRGVSYLYDQFGDFLGVSVEIRTNVPGQEESVVWDWTTATIPMGDWDIRNLVDELEEQAVAYIQERGQPEMDLFDGADGSGKEDDTEVIIEFEGRSAKTTIEELKKVPERLRTAAPDSELGTLLKATSDRLAEQRRKKELHQAAEVSTQ